MDACARQVDAVLHKIARVGLANRVPVDQTHIVKALAQAPDQFVVGAGPTPGTVHIQHHHRLAIAQLLQQGPKLLFCQIAIGAQVDDRGVTQLCFLSQALHQFQAIAALAAYFGLYRGRGQAALQVGAGTQQNRVANQGDFLVVGTRGVGCCHGRGAGRGGWRSLCCRTGLERRARGRQFFGGRRRLQSRVRVRLLFWQGRCARHKAQNGGVHPHQRRSGQGGAAPPRLGLGVLCPAGFHPAVRGFGAQQCDDQSGRVDPGQLQGVGLRRGAQPNHHRPMPQVQRIRPRTEPQHRTAREQPGHPSAFAGGRTDHHAGEQGRQQKTALVQLGHAFMRFGHAPDQGRQRGDARQVQDFVAGL